LIEDTKAPVDDNSPFILSEDPISRIRRLFHFDESTGMATVHSQQLLDPVLADNEEMRKYDDGRWRGDGQHHIGRIPMIIWHSLPEEVKNDHKALLAWLDRSENEPFRTKGGSLT